MRRLLLCSLAACLALAGCGETRGPNPCGNTGALALGTFSGSLDGGNWSGEGGTWTGTGSQYQIILPDTDGAQVTLILSQGDIRGDEDEELASVEDLFPDPVEAVFFTVGDLAREGATANVRADGQNDTLTSEKRDARGGTLWVDSLSDGTMEGCFDLHAVNNTAFELEFESVLFRLPEFQ